MAFGCSEPAGAPRRRASRVSKRKRRAFLDHLATTCHVQAAADTAGVSARRLCWLWRHAPAFATEWREALAFGYEMLETQLVRHALTGGRPPLENGAGEPIHVDLALKLLAAHRNGLAGKPHQGARPPKVATREETDAAILKQLDIYERRMKAEAEAAPAPDGG